VRSEKKQRKPTFRVEFFVDRKVGRERAQVSLLELIPCQVAEFIESNYKSTNKQESETNIINANIDINVSINIDFDIHRH